MPQFDDLERALAGFLECQDRPSDEEAILSSYTDVRHLIELMLDGASDSIPETRAQPAEPNAIPPTASVPLAASAPVGASPESIRHYQIVREIGRGGMGVVFEGYDSQLQRRVAIKSIKWDRQRDQLRIERFRREARLLASLQHPNIGAIYSFEEADEGHFLILEYIDGTTWGKLLQHGPMAIDDAIVLASQVAVALAAAHDQGVAHRDLSPANVMVRADGKVKVLDFGLARSIGEERPNDVTQSPVMGTPNYISPETLEGARSRTSADIWAFGCLLFEALSGTRAFDGPTVSTIVSEILNNDPAFDRLPKETPEPVVQMLRSCFQKDPTERLQSLHEAVSALTGDRGSTDAHPARWNVSARALQRVVESEAPLTLRVYVENIGKSATKFAIEFDPENGRAWDLLEPCPRPFQLDANEAREFLMVLKAGEPGSRRLPEIRIKGGDEVESIVPSPSTVTIEDRALCKPVLHRREWDTLKSALDSVLLDSAVQGSAVQGSAVQGSATPDSATSEFGTLNLIVGASGNGRTTTLDHLERLSRRLGYRCLRANARSGVGQRLKLAHDLLRHLLVIVESEQRDESLEMVARERLAEFLGHGSPNVDYFVSQLLGEETEPEDSPAQQYRWYRLLASAAKATPCILLLDDLDHGDSASLELLQSHLERCREDAVPFMAFGTVTNSEGLPSDATSLDRFVAPSPRVKRIVLEPFDANDVDSFLALRYPGADHHDYVPGLADAIVARTGGHAGMTNEFVTALADAGSESNGFYRRVGSSWTIRSEVNPESLLASLPSQYVDLLSRHLDPISDQARAVFETAGLLGTVIPVSALERLFDDDGVLDDSLDELESRGILAPEDPELTRYRFSNPSYAVLAIRHLDRRGSRKSRRRRLEVSKCLQELFPEPRHAEELGLRLLELGDSGSALPHLMIALEQHVRMRQVAEADRLATRTAEVIDQLDSDDPRLMYEWLILESRVHASCGRLDRATDAAERAKSLAEQLEDTAAEATCLVQQSEIAFRHGKFETVRTLANQACSLTKTPELERIHADAVQNLASAYRRLGDHDQARDLWEENRRRFVNSSDRSGEARATHNLGILHYSEDRLDEAEKYFHTAEQIAVEIDNLDFVMNTRVWLCNVSFKRGNLIEARTGYRTAVQAFQKLQNRRALSRNYYNLAEVEILLGDLAAARPSADRAASLCAEMSDHATEAEYRLSRATLEWLAGDQTQARGELARARAVCDKITAPIRRQVFDARAALLEERLGDAQSMIELAKKIEIVGSKSVELALLEATALARAKQRAHQPLDPEEIARHVELIRRAGLDTLTEAVALAAALLPFTAPTGSTIASLLGFQPEDSPASAWIELALPKLQAPTVNVAERDNGGSTKA